MKTIIALLPLCAALLSSASPLGDRALFRKHNGAALSRRYMLSSNFNAPAACSAGSVPAPSSYPGIIPVPDNSTVSIPDPSNITDSGIPDNSTVSAPITVPDNSTDTNSTITAPDNSTETDTTVDSDTGSNSTISKRYTYSDFEDDWYNLCISSGGDVYDESDPCFTYGIGGFSALMADADVCAQQENADEMITFAKSRGVTNSLQLIQLAISYRKLPRESVEINGFYPSTPYCTVQPINSELYGVWNEQPEGVSIGLYGGPNYAIVPFGDDDSCPYGQTPDVRTCSCIDNFYGPYSGFPSAALGGSTVTDTPDTANATATATATAVDSTDASASASTTAAASSASASDAAATDSATDSASATVASSASAASDAAATPVELSGNPNDPNGRRRRAFF